MTAGRSEMSAVAYDSTIAANLGPIAGVVRAGDVVVLHDPQTAGLAPGLASLGAHVVWVCHVGVDHPSEART